MMDLIIGAILVIIIGAAVAYIVKSKKSGVKCIGCPSGGCNPKKCGSSAESGYCSCHANSNER